MTQAQAMSLAGKPGSLRFLYTSPGGALCITFIGQNVNNPGCIHVRILIRIPKSGKETPLRTTTLPSVSLILFPSTCNWPGTAKTGEIEQKSIKDNKIYTNQGMINYSRRFTRVSNFYFRCHRYILLKTIRFLTKAARELFRLYVLRQYKLYNTVEPIMAFTPQA